MRFRKIPAVYWVLPLTFALIVIAWAFLPMDDWLDQLSRWVDSLGLWGIVVFAIIYIVATTALIPGAPLSIMGGLLFTWWALPLVWVSAVIGAAIAFVIARYLAKKSAQKVTRSNQSFNAIDRVLVEDGWKIVMLVRLSPLVPFNLQNYFFGTTNIQFWHYICATAVGIIPGSTMYVYLGAAASAAGDSVYQWLLLGVGLLATIFVAWYISHKAKQQLDKDALQKA